MHFPELVAEPDCRKIDFHGAFRTVSLDNPRRDRVARLPQELLFDPATVCCATPARLHRCTVFSLAMEFNVQQSSVESGLGRHIC